MIRLSGSHTFMVSLSLVALLGSQLQVVSSTWAPLPQADAQAANACITDKYEYQMTLSTAGFNNPGQAPAGGGWSVNDQACIRSNDAGCLYNAVIWRKASATNYEYQVSSCSNPGGGWTKKAELQPRVSGDGSMKDFCFWERQGGTPLDIKLAHAGTGYSQEVNCQTSQSGPTVGLVRPGAEYNTGFSRACVQNFGGPCTSDICLMGKTEVVCPVVVPQCRDGIDNDGDGAADFPSDFSCSSAEDTDETNPKSQCQDGVDNDGDGLVDNPQDPGCSSKQDNDEFNAPPPPATPTFSLSKTANVNTVAQGGFIMYTLTATNIGNAAHTVRLADNVTASGLIYVPAGSTAGCSLSAGVVYCANQSVAPGQTISVQLKFQVPATATCGGNAAIDNVLDIQKDNHSFAWSSHVVTPVTCKTVTGCSDGFDNDSDGQTDFPSDSDCSSPDDETEATPVCPDNSPEVVLGGNDNDGVRYTNTQGAGTFRVEMASPNGLSDAQYAHYSWANWPTDAIARHHGSSIFVIKNSAPVFTTTADGSVRVTNSTLGIGSKFFDPPYNQSQKRAADSARGVGKSIVLKENDTLDFIVNEVQGNYGDNRGSVHVKICKTQSASSSSSSAGTPNLSIEKTTQQTTAQIGTPIFYNIRVRNTGNATAQNIRLIDIVPFGLSYIAAGSDTSCSAQVVNGVNQVNCSAFSLNANAERTFTLKFMVNQGQLSCGAAIRNQADITADNAPLLWDDVFSTIQCANSSSSSSSSISSSSSSSSSNSSSSSSSSSSSTGTSRPDLIISKTGASTVNQGGQIVYTLTVTNIGSGSAEQVVVNDTLAAGTSLLSSNGASCTQNTATNVACALGTIAAGQTRSFTLTLQTVSAVSCNTSIFNTAVVTTTTQEENTSNNASQTVNTLVTCSNSSSSSSADFSISVTDDETSVDAGDTLTYKITVKNHQNVTVNNVTVTDILTNDLEFDDCSNSCSRSGQTITWNNLSFGPGETKSLKLEAIVDEDAEGTVGNTVYVFNKTATDYTDVEDVDSDEDEDEDTELDVSKDASTSEVFPGGIVEYTVRIKNTGDTDIEDITIEDHLPQGMTVVDDGDADSRSNNRLVWEIDELEEGETWTVRYSLRVDMYIQAGTLLRNNVDVTADDDDIDVNAVATVAVIGYMPQTGLNRGDLLQNGSNSAAPAGIPLTIWLSIIGTGAGAGIGIARKYVLNA